MITHALVIDSHPLRRAHALDALRRVGVAHCAATESFRVVRDELCGGLWEVLVCALNEHETDVVDLIDTLSACDRKPDLIFITPLEQNLLASAMRLARGHHLRVRGYVNDPVNPALLKSLLVGPQPFVHEPAPSHLPTTLAQGFECALARGELEVVYLPQMACASPTRDVIAVEALPRWHHPEYGALEARDFVAQITASADAPRLLHYMLQEIGKASAVWWRHGFHPAISCGAPLALLTQPDYPATLLSVIRESGLHVYDITFDLDPADISRQARQTLSAQLLRLRLHGIELALNNYGSRDTTLADLIDLPISEIKLSPELTHGIAFDPVTRRLMAGTISLAKSLDMRIVATSIEQEPDRAMLSALGCDFVQGDIVGSAQSASALVHRLNHRASACVPGCTSNNRYRGGQCDAERLPHA